MGSPKDEWGHPATAEDQIEVTLTRGFSILQYELTQKQWTAHGLANPSGLWDNDTGDCLEPGCPVGRVTWFEALAFSNLLSEAEGFSQCYQLIGCSGILGEGMACETVKVTVPSLYDCQGYRLPTEAEWEYAARAGTTSAFYSGDITLYSAESDCNPDEGLEPIAWYCHNAGPTTHPVGEKAPNGWGLYDMSGNAHEWVQDHYTPGGYGSGPLTDPDGDFVQNDVRVKRGGAFNLWASACRSANRSSSPWESRTPSIGFRLVRTIHE